MEKGTLGRGIGFFPCKERATQFRGVSQLILLAQEVHVIEGQ